MIGTLFRLPPLVYFILAPILAALGVFGMLSLRADDAERRAALSHAAPAAVQLESVSSAETGNDYNEIVLNAQADVWNTMIAERKKRGRVRSRTTFVPLYSTTAPDFEGAVIGVLEVDGEITDAELEAMYTADGPAGPIFTVNGVLDESTLNSGAVKALSGVKTVADAVYTVEPFLNGREEGLAVKEHGSNLLIFALILAALVGGYGFLRKRSLDKAAEEDAAMMGAAPL